MYWHIRELRKEKGLSQEEIARLLTCSQRVYSNYERGEANIPLDILCKLADFHDVSVDYLLGRTEKREINR